VKQTIDYIAEMLYAGAFLVCWAGTAGLLWVAFGVAAAPPERVWEYFVAFIKNSWGIVLLDVVALLLFLIGIYFLAQWLQARRRWKRIQHESPRGPVEISLFAIRSYIERILAYEFGLQRYRVALENTSNGLYTSSFARSCPWDAMCSTPPKRSNKLSKRTSKTAWGLKSIACK
jgi:hypothetical protein